MSARSLALLAVFGERLSGGRLPSREHPRDSLDRQAIPSGSLRRRVRRGAVSVASILALGLAACGGDDGGGPIGPAVVAEVEVAPAQATIEVGSTQPFTAVARDSDGNVLTGRTVSWSVQSPSVATIDSGSGLATGVGAGSTTVTATIEGVRGTAELAVELADFAPSSNTSISGEPAFDNVNVPAGVTVTVTGPLVMTVTGDVTIAGTFTGDCHAIEFRVDGDFTLDGLLSNVCSTDPGGAGGDLTIVADGEQVIGSAVSAADAIVSDGTVFLTDSEGEDADLETIVTTPTPAPARSGSARQAGGNGTTINRPVRAKRGGSEVRVNRTGGPVTVNGDLEAADGDDSGPPRVDGAVCDASNAFGGTGGSVRLASQGNRVFIGINVTLTAGNGGKGGDCTANAPAGESATSSAGEGGIGGTIFFGGEDIVFETGVVLEKGNGGPGGDAIANGGDGVAPCEDGYAATASGGKGGRAGGVAYILLLPGEIVGEPTETHANGGKGGRGEAVGGNGADCECNVDDGAGGDGGLATADGGMGGNGARDNIWPIAPGSHLKGEGGDADAAGGEGGLGAGCCEEGLPGGDGGKGGDAQATGGPMGERGLGGDSRRGDANAEGGAGGDGGDGVAIIGLGGAGGQPSADGHDIDETDGTDGADGEFCPQIGGAFLLTGVGAPTTVTLGFTDATHLPDVSTFMVVGLDPAQGAVTDVEVQEGPPVEITFTFTPAAGFSGTAEFQVKVSDESGSQTNLAPVTVLVSNFIQQFILRSQGVSTIPAQFSTLTIQHEETGQEAGTLQVVPDGPVFQSNTLVPGPRFGFANGGVWFFDLWSLSIAGDGSAAIRATQLCFVNLSGVDFDNPILIFLQGDTGGSSPPLASPSPDPNATQSSDEEVFGVTGEGCGKVLIRPEHRWLIIQNRGSLGDFLDPHFYIETTNEYTANPSPGRRAPR